MKPKRRLKMTTPIEILEEARELHAEKANEIAKELKEWEEMLKKENDKVHEFDKAIELLSKSPEVSEANPIANETRAMSVQKPPLGKFRNLAEELPQEIEQHLTQKHFKFNDFPGVPLPVNECITTLKTVKYGKRKVKFETEFTIRANNTESVLKATWDELTSFYNRLPERTPLKNITGINKSKVAILMDFYCEHRNFTCKIETLGKGNEGRTILLVKEEVTVNNDTAPSERHIDVEEP